MGHLPSRALTRITARLLLLALSVTTLGPMLHGAHDPDLKPVVVYQDASEAFQAAHAPDHDGAGDHCLACHFVRSSRGPASWQFTGFQSLAAGHLLSQIHGQLALPPSAAPLPARAPPLA